MLEVSKALDEFESDKTIGCVMVTGRGRAFAAGADIKEMLPLTYAECAGGDFLSHWSRLAKNVKPTLGTKYNL